MNPIQRILVCDDDSAVRSSLDFLLKKAGYEPVTVSDPSAILNKIRESDFSLVLLDMNFSLTIKGEEGIEILRKIKTLSPVTPVILITAWGSIELAVKGIKLGAYDFITKPWNNSHLLRIIETAISLSGNHPEARDDDRLPEFREIIGRDPGLTGIIELIRRVAPTHAPVLITGESGTGKELIASAIHNYSPRKSNPFVKVNLGGIPAGLFESEMFGYRKGAFTDAKNDHAGRFERANTGTIFLDEIGDLALSSQVKLLRVLQDQTFEKLGDSNCISVDVRILSATNHNLYSLVEKGLFREDLLYRINLIQIEVPPLRKRKGDIPLLADHFIDKAVRTYCLPGKLITPEAMEWLNEQTWPGNVRELKNIVERTLLVTPGDKIHADDFRSAQNSGRNPGSEQGENLAAGTIDEMEKAMIKKVIRDSGGICPGQLRSLVSAGLHFTGSSGGTESKSMIMSKRLTIIWFTFVFLIFLALAVFAFHKLNPFLLVLSEILIPVLFIVTVYFYLKAQKPIESISNSLNLLKEGDFSTTLVPVHSREVNRIIEVYNSMIAKLRQERLSVREKNHFLDLLIESSPLGIIITDLDGKITHINKTAFTYAGLSKGNYAGQYLTEINCGIIPGLSRLEYDKKQLIGLPDGQKFLCRKLYFMDRGFRHPFYLIEEFTEEIRKAEKVAYGKLIRMMAHEVNNTIGSVNSIMATLQSSADSFAEKDKDEITGILEVAIQRNHQLNRFMQNLSRVVRLPPPDKEPMDLGASLRVVAASFSAVLQERNIIMGTMIPDEPVVISADRSQMEQVFTNIIKNSTEAIENEGRINITLKHKPLSVTIEDDGIGLSGNPEEPVFTPFFSAKPGGQGIGLTLVQEILAGHGFTFSLKNRETKGAEFTIFFK